MTQATISDMEHSWFYLLQNSEQRRLNLKNDIDILSKILDDQDADIIQLVKERKFLKQKYKECLRMKDRNGRSLNGSRSLDPFPSVNRDKEVIAHLQGELERCSRDAAFLRRENKQLGDYIKQYDHHMTNANRAPVPQHQPQQNSKGEDECNALKDEITALKYDNQDIQRKLDLSVQENRALKEKLRTNEALLQRKVQELNRANEDLRSVTNELNDTKTRLSKLMGDRLTDNNPNIADLGDKNRPTKLAERYTELYDNQWTDAFEVIDTNNEVETVNTLLLILQDTFKYCSRQSKLQLDKLQRELLLSNENVQNQLTPSINKQLKDARKATAETAGDNLYKDYMEYITTSDSAVASAALKVPKYVRECFLLCWLMSVQDPPVVLAPDSNPGDHFDTDVYRSYTTSGPSVDYVVWPPLLLHERGALLCKGVAQGSSVSSKSQHFVNNFLAGSPAVLESVDRNADAGRHSVRDITPDSGQTHYRRTPLPADTNRSPKNASRRLPESVYDGEDSSANPRYSSHA